ncbi:Uncharacterised protein [uncultured archaeon]|nr:Uncharacterised protein [uncultured archaeon]
MSKDARKREADRQARQDEQVLPHLRDARPDFVAQLRELKKATLGPEDSQRAEGMAPKDVLDFARRHAGRLGYTDGDLALLRDALHAGSKRLKDTSIGLRTGEFVSRFVAHVEEHAGLSVGKPARRAAVPLDLTAALGAPVPSVGNIPSASVLRILAEMGVSIRGSPSETVDPNKLYIGPSKPVDEWFEHMNRVFYGVTGRGLYFYFDTLVSEDPMTGFGLANDFHAHLRGLAKVPDELVVHEYGIGNGNLSAAFLYRMRALDVENGTDYFRRTKCVLCDFSDEVLTTVRTNPFLMQFEDNLVFAKLDGEKMQPSDSAVAPYFRDGCVQKMYSNELADALPAQVVTRPEGTLGIGYVRPYLKKDVLSHLGITDLDGLVRDYAAGDVEALKTYPDFFLALDVETPFVPAAPSEIREWNLVDGFLKETGGASCTVNYGFHNHLRAVRRLMDVECGQGYDIFDVGIRNPSEVREGGTIANTRGDMCFCVNFVLASRKCPSLGLGVVALEPQLTFIGREVEPAVPLIDLLATHPGYPQIKDDDPTKQEFIKLVSACLNPHIDNVIHRFSFKEALGELVNGLAAEGALEGVPPDWVRYLRSEHVIDAEYERLQQDGTLGIRHQFILLPRKTLEASMEGLEELGFSREAVLGLFDRSVERSETGEFTHMRVTPS